VLGDKRLQGDSGQFGKLPGELCYKLGTTIGCDYFGGFINSSNMHKIQICQFSGRAGLPGKEAECHGACHMQQNWQNRALLNEYSTLGREEEKPERSLIARYLRKCPQDARLQWGLPPGWRQRVEKGVQRSH
jgi:hypothetical protein